MDRTEYKHNWYLTHRKKEVKPRLPLQIRNWRNKVIHRITENARQHRVGLLKSYRDPLFIRKWRNKVREKVKKIKHPEHYKASSLVRSCHIPLAEFCEACPEDDKRKAIQHHHFDYDCPDLFVSCCRSCHNYLNRTTLRQFPLAVIP